MKKLSKSDGIATYTKAQVFRSGVTGGWLAACQEGCGGIKYIPNASQPLMFKIAESHMAKEHPGEYRHSLINGR
jgi:hypothetical protein